METPDSSQRAHRRRLIVFVLVCLTAVLVLAFFAYFKDAPPGDHSDLKPDPTRYGNDKASYEAWLAAIGKADGSVWTDAMDSDFDFHETVSGRKPWEGATTERILTANRAALDEAIRADALGEIHLPPMESFEDDMSYFSGFQLLCKTLKLLTIERAHAGDFATAREAALVNLRLGDRLVTASGSLLGYLVGASCQSISYSAIERVAELGAPDEVLGDLMKGLVPETNHATAFQQAIRVEFQLFGGALEMKGRSREIFGGIEDAPPLVLFNRNRTLNAVADVCRDVIADTTVPPAKRMGSPPSELDRPWSRFSINAFGKYLVEQATPPYWSILSKGDDVTANRRLLRVKLALLRHERAEGKLPAVLSDLVPRFLDAVPTDPFDGNPVRYDAARGMVWVLGKDLTDEGGTPEAENGFSGKDDDPSLLIHPAAP